MLIHSAVITGSVQFNNTDVSGITNVSSFATTASVDAVIIKTGSFATTSSVNELQSKTGSYASTSSVNELQSKTGSYTSTSSFGTYTSSNDSTNTTQNTRLSTIESRTGSFATTGSNTFIGTNVFTGSVFITSDLVVQGSSSLQNITASAVSIGTNTVILNTNTPILQFGGISVQDSGSTAGRSGSLLWNSVNDHWINVNPSGSDEGYNSAMVINGPKNTGSLGAEAGLTLNYIPVSQGEDHITDSIIFQSGSTNIGIGTTTPTARLEVAGTSKFGTTAANTHQFTGSVLMSGSLTATGQINSFNDRNYISRGALRLASPNNNANVLDIQLNDTTTYITGNYYGGGSDNTIIIGTYDNNTNQLVLKPSGNIGIKQTSPRSLLEILKTSGNTSLGVASNFSLLLSQGGAINEYSQIGLGYTNVNSPGVIGFLTTNAASYTSGALIFATRNATTDTVPTERMRITSTGILDQNGVGRVCFSGRTSGNGSFSVTVSCSSESSMKVTCMFNHYGLFTGYGCAKMSFYANGPSSDESAISNITSGNGGSWSIARINNTSFSITKNAGSYGGDGYYFIEVIGANLT